MIDDDQTTLAARRATRRPGPSMADVAALAGVSSQTVSRVTNGQDGVRPETRQRVLGAMESLGYVPNSAARALRSGRFGAIGLIAHKVARTGEAGTIEGVVAAARELDLTVNLLDRRSLSPQSMNEAVDKLSHQSIDGLVIIRSELEASEISLPRRLPVVVSDFRLIGHHPAVGTDQQLGARLAVEHLIGLGHRTVHHLAGPTNSGPARARLDGWERALRDADREVPQPGIGEWTGASGYAWASAVDLSEVTSIFCANDEMAVGVMRALDERGVRIPQDVSVVGFDDVSLAAYLWPPLTTVRQDFARIGHELVRVLSAQMDGGRDLTDHRTTLPVELIVRESSAPPRPAGIGSGSST